MAAASQLNPFDNVMTIILVGAMAVGKSSLLRQFIKGTFDPLQQSTITTDSHVCEPQNRAQRAPGSPPATHPGPAQSTEMTIDGRRVRLQVNDTAGQERFDAIVGQYFRGAHGVMVVLDVTDPAGVPAAEAWLERAQNHCSSLALAPKFVGVANKIDKKENRVLPSDAATKWAASHGMPVIETSARTGEGVQEAFTALVRAILRDASLAAATRPRDPGQAAPTVSIAPQPQGTMDGSCCG